jgi:hypothetical protein
VTIYTPADRGESQIQLAGANECQTICALAWHPDGADLVLTDETPAGYIANRYSAATGAQGKPLPFHGYIAGSWSWSPDRKYAIVFGPTSSVGGWRVKIVNATTGAFVDNFIPAGLAYDSVYWATNDRLVVTNGDQIGTYTVAGDLVSGHRVPAPAVGGWYAIGKS